MKHIFFTLLLISILSMVGARGVWAQSLTGSPSYTISYPIIELGGCSSLSECKLYCDDPLHKDSCIAYAQTKGFYNKETLNSKKEELLQKAKSELGCDSEESCRTLCSKEDNIDICSSFAKRYSLPGGKNDSTQKSSVLASAKTSLGCSSKSECKALCEKEEHKIQCSEFAKKHNLAGGIQKTGPGGCTGEDTCKEYCQDDLHADECSRYGVVTQKSFEGPGGCNSVDSCKAYCVAHAQECEAFMQQRRKSALNDSDSQEPTPNTNQEQKKSIIQIFQKSGEKDSVSKGKTNTTIQKRIRNEVKTTKPTQVPSSGEFKKQTPNTLFDEEARQYYLETKIEACIQHGCIWKETYCDCSSAYVTTPTPSLTPTRVPTPTTTFEYELETSQEQETIQNTTSGSSVTGDDVTVTSGSVQGAATSNGFFNFIKTLFK